jgi:hypothetical protein
MTYASKYYNIKYESSITDQGSWGTCVPSSIVASLYEMMNQAGHPIPVLSRLFSYYDGREALGTTSIDSGNVAAVNLYLSESNGIAPEYVWNYTEQNLYAKPPQWMYDYFAKDYKVDMFMSLNTLQTSEQIRENVLSYLTQGKTIITSFKVRDFLYNESGSLSTQIAHGNGPVIGNHCVDIVGWDSSVDGGSYIIRNSWGIGWGDGGYGTISYRQFGSDALYGDHDLLAMQVVTGMRVEGKIYDFSWTPIRETLTEQYVTIFNRPADLDGMNWHISNNLAAVVYETEFSDMLINSYEGSLLYGDKTNREFVNMMYHSILDRDGETAGLDYWEGILNQGYSRGFVSTHMLAATKLPGGEGHERFENKVEMAMYTTITHQWNGKAVEDVKYHFAQVTADDNALEILKIGIPDSWSG